ncbi:hypothetical protein J5N97_023491 [Dioscorea zingiberensis]|uniref:Uncharacterized protein n=1 Tax=Dioscorea zingiberensis TaxID=325984 RepID=A0A9D5H7W8_9LILI|nr:hypothetical protein J5N97_023491 [Dioscorea zingiberensis]
MAHFFPRKLALLLLLLASLSIASSSVTKSCRPSGYLWRKAGGGCFDSDPDCCRLGKKYPKYLCSPLVTNSTSATMTLGSFSNVEENPTSCDTRSHSDSEIIIALSTGWYNGGSRCLKNINIHGNGKSVLAKVVDECDSMNGCDADHEYEKPCANNVVDASSAVWEALGFSKSQMAAGAHSITWSDV